MIAINKGQSVKTLPFALAEISDVYMESRGISQSLDQLPTHDIQEFLKKHQEVGQPRYFAFCRDTCQLLLIAPRPDHRYLLRVHGYQRVEL